jgi:hypothetical protein
MTRRPAAWIDRGALALMSVSAVAISTLNLYAIHDFHTIDKHLVFRERILHGFAVTDVIPSYTIPPTFPMWGYGFVLLLTTNQIALIALQTVVALATVWFLMKVLEENGIVNEWAGIVLRALLVICIPWYAYNSIVWSQSLATSCLVVCIALLIRAVHQPSSPWWPLALSAICLGLNLNFASDLYLLPVLLAFIYWVVMGRSRPAAAQAALWLATVFLTLVPWMWYTWRATGTPLMKSTNQGHVLLIGLSQDPENRFGITYSDTDPTMYRIIADELGPEFARRFYASCSFEADRVLRPAFVRMVSAQPWAYADLVLYRIRLILTGRAGTYTGEFDQGENAHSFGVGLLTRQRLHRMSRRMGFLLQVGTTVLGPFVAWLAIRRREPAWAFVLGTIVYQYLSLSVAVLQPQYISNLIVLQLLVVAQAVGVFCAYLTNRAANRTAET